MLYTECFHMRRTPPRKIVSIEVLSNQILHRLKLSLDKMVAEFGLYLTIGSYVEYPCIL